MVSLITETIDSANKVSAKVPNELGSSVFVCLVLVFFVLLADRVSSTALPEDHTTISELASYR